MVSTTKVTSKKNNQDCKIVTFFIEMEYTVISTKKIYGKETFIFYITQTAFLRKNMKVFKF